MKSSNLDASKQTIINNYIQINNIIISKEGMAQLPTGAILEIEALISMSIIEK
ncbi:hypothetical protein [Winogradskyella bathintestinalis]|uniref:hypothetical protein n=1 Tax=Winogradskyella bathintestinalis TaxID=3035208 RepID=UPI0025B43C3C|nr:hypothetical protein [Winogradskyella bathintestinalis]